MAAVVTDRMDWRSEGKAGKMSETRFSMDSEEDDEERVGTFFLPIQHHSRPATPADVAFERDVLSLPGGKTESELNKHYSLAAQDLGIELVRKRSRDHGDAKHQNGVNDSALTVASSIRDSFSRTSQSTPPTSCDSSEMQNNTQYARSYQSPPSVIASSRPIDSRPPSVMSSTKSITSSIRSGLRRLSTFSRRSSRVVDFPNTESSSSFTNIANIIMPLSPRLGRRPSTGQSTSQSTVVPPSPTMSTHNSDTFSTYHSNVPKMLSPPTSPRTSRSPHRPLSRGQSLPSIASVSAASGRTIKNFSAPFPSPRAKSSDTRTLGSYRPLTPTREEGFTKKDEQTAAQSRSMRNRDLQRLRTGQLEEQRRFLNFQQVQHARIRSKHSEKTHAHKRLWRQKEREMEEQQAEKEAEMEQRQLTAEFELIRNMEMEKKSVDARLRHMEGYVKGATNSVYETGSIGTAISTDDGSSGITDASYTISAKDLVGVPGDRDSGLHLTVQSSSGGGGGSSTGTTPSPSPTPSGSHHHQQQQHQQQPARVVSSRNMAMLGQQYRIRSQLPQLQASRIKVLREQQAQRLARLQDRHQAESDAFLRRRDAADDDLDAELRESEADLRVDFDTRRERMQWRWTVAEKLERRRLEDDRAVPFAELPAIEWSADAWKGERMERD